MVAFIKGDGQKETAARPARAVRVKGARTTHLNTTFAKESSKNLLYQFRSFGNRKSAIAPPLRLLAGVLWSAWLGLGLGLGL